MIKVVALIALMLIVLVALLRLVAGKNRSRDCYIRRDYEKFKRLDAQLERQATASGLSSRERHPDVMP
jgi:hypothetical protein